MPLLGKTPYEAKIYAWLKADSDLETLMNVSLSGKIKVDFAEPKINATNTKIRMAISINLTEEDESFPAEFGNMQIKVFVPAHTDKGHVDYIKSPYLHCTELRDHLSRLLGPENVTNMSDAIDPDDPSTTKIRFAQSIRIAANIEHLDSIKHYLVNLSFRIVVSVNESYSAANAGDQSWV